MVPQGCAFPKGQSSEPNASSDRRMTDSRQSTFYTSLESVGHLEHSDRLVVLRSDAESVCGKEGRCQCGQKGCRFIITLAFHQDPLLIYPPLNRSLVSLIYADISEVISESSLLGYAGYIRLTL